MREFNAICGFLIIVSVVCFLGMIAAVPRNKKKK